MWKKAWVDIDPLIYENIMSGKSKATEVAIRNGETSRFQHFANFQFDDLEYSAKEKTAVVLGVGLAVTAVFGCYKVYKHFKQKSEEKACEQTTDFQMCLQGYFNQAHDGCLQTETVNELLECIDRMTTVHEEQFTDGDSNALVSVVGFVNDYTQKILFETSKRVHMEFIIPNYEATFDNLKKCLQIQKQALQMVA